MIGKEKVIGTQKEINNQIVIRLDGEIADRKERTDIERTKAQNEHEARIIEINNKHENDKIILDMKAEEVRGKQINESKQIDYNHEQSMKKIDLDFEKEKNRTIEEKKRINNESEKIKNKHIEEMEK